tara:strand:- start:1254 stop:1454 length:201 start_codon:yes stop_codon:yes gene_type:complete
MIEYLKAIAIFAGVFFSFFLGRLKSENKRLEEDSEEKDSTINSIKENEKVKETNSTMSKSDLINGL